MGCEKSGNDMPDTAWAKLFVTNEGPFGSSQASVSSYDPVSGNVSNDLYKAANGTGPGAVLQSMGIYGDSGYLVMNGDGNIIRVNLSDFKETGRIGELGSPRYIHFMSADKAYISKIGSGDIIIVNPRDMKVTGKIETGLPSTEQFIQNGKYAYVNSWSYGNCIIKLDTETDKIAAILQIGEQPKSMAIDCNGKLWVITDGGWTTEGTKKEKPALHIVNLDTFTEEKKFEFGEWDSVSGITANKEGNMLYYINSGVFAISCNADGLPETPLISAPEGSSFYALTVSPLDSDIYVSDAKDYTSKGSVTRYSASGEKKSAFDVGICPGNFCWLIMSR